jgi:hypothetical protein
MQRDRRGLAQSLARYLEWGAAHQYHEDAFALYYGAGPVNPGDANQPLIDLLTAKLHAAP